MSICGDKQSTGTKRVRSLEQWNSENDLRNHLSQWRMNVEEERAVDVPTGHLAEMRFVPTKKWHKNQI
jgi:hypothetical protein